MTDLFSKRELCIALLIASFIAMSILHNSRSSSSNSLSSQLSKQTLANTSSLHSEAIVASPLEKILRKASYNQERTVILAPLNKAWASNGSMVNYFLQSFNSGIGTSPLLDHLVLVALDQAAYDRCVSIHKHCFVLETEGVDFSAEKVFMAQDYLKMTRRKIEFLGLVLQLGFDFIFTDVDILWFRDPWKHLSSNLDFEVACDSFNGNEDDINNVANTGFIHVRANNITVELYKFWHRYTGIYQDMHDQDVFNSIKSMPEFQALGAKMRFLPTSSFSNFCEESSRDMNKLVTMHANCCIGLAAKLADLELIAQDWQRFLSLNPAEKEQQRFHFSAPDSCKRSW